MEYELWKGVMQKIEDTYNEMMANGTQPQEARRILPNSLKTEIFMTMNLREWRHFFRLRCSERAHPQMREIACMIYDKFVSRYPIFLKES